MHKKLLGTFTALALVTGLLAFGAAPASATHTTVDSVASFMPNAGHDDKDALSDAHDGTDETAHLTATADPAADRVIWYYCAPGDDPGDNTCSTIGTDTSGTQPFTDDPNTPDDESQSAEAYDYEWNIPANLDNEYVDIFVVACAGAPNAPTDPENSTNCDFTEESDIFLDDGGTSATGGPFEPLQDIPTGEIVGVCEGGDDGSTTQERAECDAEAEFGADGHGSTLPNSDFAVLFTTSEDVTATNACLDDLNGDQALPTDADSSATGPEGCDYYADNVIQVTETSALDRDPGKTWIAFFSEGNQPDGGDLDLAIFGEGDDVANECDPWFQGTFGDGCVFDEHYKAIPERQQSEINASYGDDFAFGSNNIEEGCDQTTNEVDTDNADNVILGDAGNEYSYDWEEIEGCLFNQFGDIDPDFPGATAAALFVLEGPGDLDDWYGSCDLFDTDSDGNDDVARCSPDGDEYHLTLTDETDANGNMPRGTSTVTFCVDEEGQDDTDPEFGCADETQTSSVSKDWMGQSTDVALVFGPDSDNPADVCATGDQFRTNEEGDTDVLVVCTYDNLGNLVSTDSNDPNIPDGTLTWTNTQPNVVSFGSNPPNSTGDDGKNTLNIIATNEGSSTITVTLCYDEDEDTDLECASGEDDFNNSESASVTKTVQQGPASNPQCNNGIDDDGDGNIDYPADPGCASVDDNTENSEGTEPTITRHDRTAAITGFKHVDVGKKNPALRVKAKVSHDDGHNVPGCQNDVPVDFQIKAGGEWITRKSSNTNDNGVAKILIRDITAKYRAIAVRHELADETANTVDICRKATSPGKRHGH